MRNGGAGDGRRRHLPVAWDGYDQQTMDVLVR